MTEIDTSTFSEATKALLCVFGLLFAGGGGYIFGRKQNVKIEPSPIEVSPDKLTQIQTATEKEVAKVSTALADHILDDEKNFENIFLRLSANEKELAEIKGQMPHINQGIHRIENKLDELLMRARHD